MTSVSDWSVAFCLACDNQTHDGPYCSQSCRMADLERSHHTHPTTNRSHSTSSVPSSNSSPTQTHGLYMPPLVNFSAYQSASSTPAGITPTAATPNYHQQFGSSRSSSTSNYVLDYSDPDQARRLSLAESETDSNLSYFSPRDSSSSRSSSFYSYYATPSVSESTRQQLSSYESSFDKVRHRKYRN